MTNRRFCLLTVLAATGATLLAGLAAAQENPPGPTSRPERPGGWHRHGPGSMPAGPGGPRHRPGEGFLPLGPLGQHLLRLTPDDRGPLKPGEEEQLLGFAREHMPRMAELFERLKQHNPEKFRERLELMAPRLRHLQRVFESNPTLGNLIRDHAENVFEIENRARALRALEPGSAEYNQQRELLRQKVAQNIRYESEALEALATQVEGERDQVINERLEFLLDDKADMKWLPPDARERVQAYRDAKTDAERETRRAELRTAVAERVASDLEMLHTRAARLRDHADEEIDTRVARLLDPHARDGPPPPPGSRPGRGR